MGKEDLRVSTRPWRRIRGRSVHRVSPRRITAVCPVDHPIGEIEIDRLGQIIEKQFDVFTIGRALALRNFQACAKDPPLASIVVALLGPIKLLVLHVEGYTDTPVSRIPAVSFSVARFYERFDMRTVEIRTHDSHA